MIAQNCQVLHGEAAPKLSETWLPVYTEKILSLARREGKLALPADEMTLDAKGNLCSKYYLQCFHLRYIKLAAKCSDTRLRNPGWPSLTVNLSEQTWQRTSSTQRFRGHTPTSSLWEMTASAPVSHSLF